MRKLQIEELEQRVAPTGALHSVLTVAVALPAAAIDHGVAAPEPSAAVNDHAQAANGANGVSVSS